MAHSRWPVVSIAAIVWLTVLACAAAVVGWLPVPEPAAMNLLASQAAPDTNHWLGTDALGRDVLARALHGARVSLFVAVGAPLIGLLLGASAGIAAGWIGGRFERLILILIDSLLAFPGLILALCVTVFLGRSTGNVVLAIGVLTAPSFARVARTHTRSLLQRDFFLAARATGGTAISTLRAHLLPHLLPILLNLALLAAAVAIVVEGALSFLGLGVPPPFPSWGGMIAEGRDALGEAPWISLAPGVALFLTVASVNVLAQRLSGPLASPGLRT